MSLTHELGLEITVRIAGLYKLSGLTRQETHDTMLRVRKDSKHDPECHDPECGFLTIESSEVLINRALDRVYGVIEADEVYKLFAKYFGSELDESAVALRDAALETVQKLKQGN